MPHHALGRQGSTGLRHCRVSGRSFTAASSSRAGGAEVFLFSGIGLKARWWQPFLPLPCRYWQADHTCAFLELGASKFDRRKLSTRLGWWPRGGASQSVSMQQSTIYNSTVHIINIYMYIYIDFLRCGVRAYSKTLMCPSQAHESNLSTRSS